MVPRNPAPVSPAMALVALLVAAGLGVWSAERASDALGVGARPGDRGPGRVRGAERGAPPARAPGSSAAPALVARGVAAAQPPGAVAPDLASAERRPAIGRDAEPPAADAEEHAAAALAESLRKLARDLEYNADAGLGEPPQQLVVPPPEPWRPPASADGAPAPAIAAIEPSSAPAAGGARVVIRGRFLRPGQVMFGAALAEIVSASAGEIAVVAPRGPAGPVAVAVTNSDGTFAVAGQPFTYVAR